MTAIVRERRFADPEALAAALASSIAGDLAAAADVRGVASLVVSGGSTPRPLFRELAARELPWERVVVTLADERRVPADDPASNEGLVRRHLLRGAATAARFQALETGATSSSIAGDACAAAVAALPRPFDVVVLGMGTDGHTASLFPGAPGLAAALDPASPRLCVAVEPPAAASPGCPRLSLTLAALLDARRIVVHIVGEEKLRVWEQAVAGDDADEMPIRAVLRHAPAVELYRSP